MPLTPGPLGSCPLKASLIFVATEEAGSLKMPTKSSMKSAAGARLPILLITVAGCLALAPQIAHADPCKALPYRGPAPAWAVPGHVVTGTVRYVGDGDSLCVGGSADTSTWVEIRLADFFAPELSAPGGSRAKQTLERITRGRQINCTATTGQNGRVVSYDRLIAVCRINGTSVGDLMRRAGIDEGGNGQ